jgi:hypothetical protein
VNLALCGVMGGQRMLCPKRLNLLLHLFLLLLVPSAVISFPLSANSTQLYFSQNGAGGPLSNILRIDASPLGLIRP